MKRFKPGHAIEDAREVFYVEREADRVLFERLRDARPTIVVAPRQVGKTSLLKQTSTKLAAAGIRVVFVDLQGRGVASGTPADVAEAKWYRSLADAVARPVGLGARVKPFFDARADRTPVASWVDFIVEVVLAEVADPIVLIVDEIDRTLTLPFSRDDFFGAVRSMENARGVDELGRRWRRWTVCLCGVAAPVDLLADKAQPPAVPAEGVIRLRDLTRAQLDGFAEGLAALGGDAAPWLDAVYGWTSGHPAMTQKICGALLAARDDREKGTEAVRVERLVRRMYLDEGRSQDPLLLDVEHRFPVGKLSEEAVAVLSTYQSVRAARPAMAFRADDLSQLRLVISGLGAERDGRLLVRSRIYEEAFDDGWVASRLEGRPVALRLAAWLKSGRAETALLDGEELSRAEGWAAGRELTASEREFLASSERRHQVLGRETAEHERDEARRAARNRTLIALGGVVLAVVFLAVAVYALSQRSVARIAEQRAETERKRAEGLLVETQTRDAQEQAESAILAARDTWADRETVAAALRAAARSDVVLEAPQFLEAALAAARMAPLVGRLHGHNGTVYDAAFSPDGKRVVTASEDQTARIWDAGERTSLFKLEGHTGRVNHAAFSPDGKRVVTASDDQTARIWDADTGAVLFKLEGHASRVGHAAFSPDGRRVLTASDDGAARVWDTATGALLLDLEGHEGQVLHAAFSPDGKRVVTATSGGVAHVWDAERGVLLLALRGHKRGVVEASFSPDGRRVVTASNDATVRIWDAAVGALLFELEAGRGRAVHASFSPDGARLVTVSAAATPSDRMAPRIWNAATGALLFELRGHFGQVNDASFSPDGARVVTVSDDGDACVWDTAKGALLTRLEGHAAGVLRVAFSPDGARLVTASRDNMARVWEREEIDSHDSMSMGPGSVYALGLSQDGRRVVTISDDFRVRVWDVARRTLLTTLEGSASVSLHAALSPDGRRLVTISFPDAVHIWEAGTGEPIATFDAYTRKVQSATFLPDDERVATISADETVDVWDAKTGTLLAMLEGHAARVNALSFSPDGQHVATVSDDKTARIWDVDTSALVFKLEGHGGKVTSLAFSPDGQYLATASDDKTARIWDAGKGTPVIKLEGHTGALTSLSFSKDGKRIVTASEDKTARVWDAHTGALIATLEGHTKKVSYAVFSLDAKYVITAALDGTARIWDAAKGTLVVRVGDNNVFYMGLLPDGKHVLTGSRTTGNIRLWPTDYKAAMSDICAQIKPWIRTMGDAYKDLADICGKWSPATPAAPATSVSPPAPPP